MRTKKTQQKTTDSYLQQNQWSHNRWALSFSLCLLPETQTIGGHPTRVRFITAIYWLSFLFNVKWITRKQETCYLKSNHFGFPCPRVQSRLKLKWNVTAYRETQAPELTLSHLKWFQTNNTVPYLAQWVGGSRIQVYVQYLFDPIKTKDIRTEWSVRVVLSSLP